MHPHRTARSFLSTAPSLAVALLFAGCGGGDRAAELVVERATIGDTTVVRTIAGSLWGTERSMTPEMRIGTFEGEDVYMLGEVAGLAVAGDGSIYLYDRQVPALRKYAPDGTFVATFSREGGGPGEYKNSDGGIAALPDGRVVLRDPGNGRLNVYSATGESLGHWPFRGGYFTGTPLFVDTAGAVYAQIWGRSGDERYSALLRFAPDGTPADSLMVPEWEHEGASVQFSTEGMSMIYGVPFSPSESWSFSPLGYYVGGVSTRYAVDQLLPDGRVLRVEREVPPVAVTDAEAADEEARILAQFRRMDPDWKWNGPPIPSVKPPFRDVIAARDGRIWVQRSEPGEPVPDVDREPTPPGEVPPRRWREPVVYDVFDPDGTYLGAVRAPTGFQTHPQPIFDGDRVWAVVEDELGVEYVTRLRLVSGETEVAADR